MDMSIISQIKLLTVKALKELYQYDIEEKDLTINTTKPDFEGDYTVVLFSLIKALKKSPEQIGQELGGHMAAQHPDIFHSYNVIKGFLNFVITDNYWINFLHTNYLGQQYGKKPSNGSTIIVEYSSPNTNKPLH